MVLKIRLFSWTSYVYRPLQCLKKKLFLDMGNRWECSGYKVQAMNRR